MYTINIFKFTLIKVGKRKKKYFELVKTYKHINTKELSKKAIELKKEYYDSYYYLDIVDEHTNNCMIKEGIK